MRAPLSTRVLSTSRSVRVEPVRRTSRTGLLSLFHRYFRRFFQILFSQSPKPSWRYSFRIVKRAYQAGSQLYSYVPANVQPQVSHPAYLSRQFVSVSRVFSTGIIMSGMLPMLCVILILSVATTTVRAGLKCDAVRPYFESQGFPATDIPKEAISCKSFIRTLFIY